SMMFSWISETDDSIDSDVLSSLNVLSDETSLDTSSELSELATYSFAEEKAIKLLETAKKYVANADTSDEVSNKISSDNTLSDDNTSESIESSVSDIQENIGADKGDDEDAFSNAPLTDFEEKNSE
ncbi:MAG: hypothetical protein KKD12_02630, partial [Proteobacteria bacterium]|nr:hypothetical protein [Pseudomonadota bacterium]